MKQQLDNIMVERTPFGILATKKLNSRGCSSCKSESYIEKKRLLKHTEVKNKKTWTNGKISMILDKKKLLKNETL